MAIPTKHMPLPLKVLFRAVGPVFKGLGRAMDRFGMKLEAQSPVDRLKISTRMAPFKGATPQLAGVFVAPTATVLGNVAIGEGSSVWYGAKIRGDVHNISIGDKTSIGDNVMVHVAKIQGDFPTTIGNNVTVGPNAIIHACTIEDNALVGMGAQVLDGAVVKANAIVAPGAVVPPGKVVETGQLWAGTPAKHLRDLSDEEIDYITLQAEEQSVLAIQHAEECNKSWQQVEVDDWIHKDKLYRSPEYFDAFHHDEAYEVLGKSAPGVYFNNRLTEGTHTRAD